MGAKENAAMGQLLDLLEARFAIRVLLSLIHISEPTRPY